MPFIVAHLTEAVTASRKVASLDAAMIIMLTDRAGDFEINLSVGRIIQIVGVLSERRASGA